MYISGWKKQARDAVKAYPLLLKAKRDLQESKITPNYSGMPASHIATRTTENLAQKTLSREDEKILAAVELAISTTRRYKNSEDRLKVIDAVLWKQNYDLNGIAIKLHYCYHTVQEWHEDFLELVDAYLRVF